MNGHIFFLLFTKNLFNEDVKKKYKLKDKMYMNLCKINWVICLTYYFNDTKHQKERNKNLS